MATTCATRDVLPPLRRRCALRRAAPLLLALLLAALARRCDGVASSPPPPPPRPSPPPPQSPPPASSASMAAALLLPRRAARAGRHAAGQLERLRLQRRVGGRHLLRRQPAHRAALVGLSLAGTISCDVAAVTSLTSITLVRGPHVWRRSLGAASAQRSVRRACPA
jgi:hypothetical protein